jgi:hypothetical protein
MIQGEQQFLNRLTAIQRAPAVVSKRWADSTVSEMQRRIRRRTGATARSIHHTDATDTGSTIVGSKVATFIDSGTRAHDETSHGKAMKFTGRGRTVFSRKVHHPRVGAKPFKRASMQEGFRKSKPADTVIGAWNRGA